MIKERLLRVDGVVIIARIEETDVHKKDNSGVSRKIKTIKTLESIELFQSPTVDEGVYTPAQSIVITPGWSTNQKQEFVKDLIQLLTP